MRSLWKAGLFSTLAVAALAQRPSMQVNVPHAAPSRPAPSAHFGFNTGQHFSRRPVTPWYGGLGYPWLGGYDYYDYGYDYQPPLAAVPPPQPFPVPVIVQAPPRPIQPEIKEYNPPDTGDSKPFSIALKDGSVRAALAVWITDDGTLHYIDGEGKPGQTPLDSVDRAATKKLNDGKNVQSWLP